MCSSSIEIETRRAVCSMSQRWSLTGQNCFGTALPPIESSPIGAFRPRLQERARKFYYSHGGKFH
jgi:hypothetical protein